MYVDMYRFNACVELYVWALVIDETRNSLLFLVISPALGTVI